MRCFVAICISTKLIDFLSRSGQYATIEELLDKLLFLAVSGDGKRVYLT